MFRVKLNNIIFYRSEIATEFLILNSNSFVDDFTTTLRVSGTWIILEVVCWISLSAKTAGLIAPILGLGMGLGHFLINQTKRLFGDAVILKRVERVFQVSTGVGKRKRDVLGVGKRGL